MGRTVGARVLTRMGTGDRAKAWQAMRVLVRFTASQIEVTAEIGEANLQRFVRALVRSGHLAIERPRAPGRAGSFTIYRLARDSGPKAPILWRGGFVFDENTHQLFGPAGESMLNSMSGGGLSFGDHAMLRERLGASPSAAQQEAVRKPRSVRLNEERWAKLRRLGPVWLEAAIDRAKEP